MKLALKILMLAAITLLGCSGGSTPSEGKAPAAKAPVAKPTETELGRSAIQKTYIAAHLWTADARPFLEYSQPTKEVPGEDGESAVWSASYGSMSRSESKTFTWSGTDASDAPPRGTNPSGLDTWDVNNASTRTFDLLFLKVDSDQAYKVAQEHGGKRLTEKDPKLPITYRLSWERRDNGLEWHVLYGPSNSPKLAVDVDATTGAFIRKEA